MTVKTSLAAFAVFAALFAAGCSPQTPEPTATTDASTPVTSASPEASASPNGSAASPGTATETTTVGPPAPAADAGASGAPAPFKSNGKKITTKSGLVYEQMTPGTGPAPKPGQTVRVHYIGTLQDGTKFDSSYDRGEPIPFPLGGGQVIRGWDEGIALMKVGERGRLTIPGDLAYGAAPPPGAPIPPNATLVFDVTLVGVD